MASQFPDELNVLTVLSTQHKDFNPSKFVEAEALYEGGDKFEAMKDYFLFRKELERDNVDGMVKGKGKSYREARLQHATYSNPVAPVIDFMTAAAMQSPPQVIFRLKKDLVNEKLNRANLELEKLDESDVNYESKHLEMVAELLKLEEAALMVADRKLKYYNDLNKCIPDLLMSRFVEIILHGSSSIGVCFPKTEATNRTDQIESHGLDAKLYGISAKDMVDWVCEEDKLTMLKTYHCDKERSAPYLQPDIEKHYWTFYTENEVVEYMATKPCSQLIWKKEDIGVVVNRQVNSFGVLPIFEIYLSKKRCLLSRITKLIISHFNAEADLGFALNCYAYPQLVFTLNKNHNAADIVKSPMTAWILEKEESVEYVGTSIQFEGLEKAVIRKERLITNRLNSAALDIANRDTQGRASATAKSHDYGPINILLELYANKLRAILKDILEYIIRVRGDVDDVTFDILGMDRFDLNLDLEKKMKIADLYYKLPGSPTAKKYYASELDQLMVAHCGREVREKVHKENESLVIEVGQSVDESEDEVEVGEEKLEKGLRKDVDEEDDLVDESDDE